MYGSIQKNRNIPKSKVLQALQDLSHLLRGIKPPPQQITQKAYAPLRKQLCMSAAAHKHHHPIFIAVVECIDQQEVTTNMAFTVPMPIASQRMV